MKKQSKKKKHNAKNKKTSLNKKKRKASVILLKTKRKKKKRREKQSPRLIANNISSLSGLSEEEASRRKKIFDVVVAVLGDPKNKNWESYGKLQLQNLLGRTQFYGYKKVLKAKVEAGFGLKQLSIDSLNFDKGKRRIGQPVMEDLARKICERNRIGNELKPTEVKTFIRDRTGLHVDQRQFRQLKQNLSSTYDMGLNKPNRTTKARQEEDKNLRAPFSAASALGVLLFNEELDPFTNEIVLKPIPPELLRNFDVTGWGEKAEQDRKTFHPRSSNVSGKSVGSSDLALNVKLASASDANGLHMRQTYMVKHPGWEAGKLKKLIFLGLSPDGKAVVLIVTGDSLTNAGPLTCVTKTELLPFLQKGRDDYRDLHGLDSKTKVAQYLQLDGDGEGLKAIQTIEDTLTEDKCKVTKYIIFHMLTFLLCSCYYYYYLFFNSLEKICFICSCGCSLHVSFRLELVTQVKRATSNHRMFLLPLRWLMSTATRM